MVKLLLSKAEITACDIPTFDNITSFGLPIAPIAWADSKSLLVDGSLDDWVAIACFWNRRLFVLEPDVAKWTSLCRRRSQFRLKTFSQSVHEKGFCSECVRRWVFKFDLWLKVFPHDGHRWGESSKCKILWTARVLDWQNPFPHSVHLKGFSLEWIYLGFLKLN